MIQAEQMIMIGSSGRNAGKTTVAKALITAFKPRFKIAVLKITCVAKRGGHCPHGTEGCGICSNLSLDYDLTEELDHDSGKDTSELLAAGADRVFWLRSLYDSLETAYSDFISRIPSDMLILCESNSLRKSVAPGCFIMVHNTKHTEFKPTATDVHSFSDITLTVNEPHVPDISGLIARLDIRQSGNNISVSLDAVVKLS